MSSLQLTNKAADYEKELARMIAQMADQIVSSARKRVYANLKSRKGNSPLANSIDSAVTPEGDIRIFTDKPYAKFVEFGTINQPARPFLTPAVEEVKVTFSGLIR
ncbi:MAG: HK97 gp10 family phage protein [Emcibacter sp.]|nr:HK97 gp10 family phage protein [Emcibacter sp.]